MKKLPNLYKKDSKDRLRIWYVEIHEDRFITFAGLAQGTLKTEIYDASKIKPKGKNTFKEQLEKEAQSRWNKKRNRELYQLTSACDETPAFTQPMLALDYTKVGHRAEWDKKHFTAQPKLDGLRSTVKLKKGIVQLTSRKGKILEVPHIADDFRNLFMSNNPYINNSMEIDGELYIHGVELGDVTHAVAHGDIQLSFNVFDIVNENMYFEDRFELLRNLDIDSHPGLKLLTCTDVETEEDMKILHKKYVSLGYEGIIIRDKFAPYTINGKTPSMFKYKHFQDAEFKVIDIKRDKSGGVIFVMETPNHIAFNSRPIGTVTKKELMLFNKLKIIGNMATIRYSVLLKSGVPEFNRLITLRNYE